MAEQRYCSKCQRTMSDVKFYKYRDGTSCELCKTCLTMHINNYEEDTYLWLMEKFDIPYIPAEWKKKREAEFEKAYNKVLTGGVDMEKARAAAYNMTKGNSVVFGKYLASMKLKQHKDEHWADTERLKLEAEQKAQRDGVPSEEMQEKIANMKAAYERGEISEAQYMTYADFGAAEEQAEALSLEEQFLDAGGPAAAGNPNSYPVNEHPFEEVQLVDVGKDLTDEDKVYLAMKWGKLYSAADWVALEKLYNEFMESFDIKGAARLDTLKMICKTSLKMNQAIDCGDVETYQRLSRVYDSMMKAAKFTEAQRKEEASGEFDCVGQICLFAESKKGGGKIPRHKIDTPLDIVDATIDKLKRYYSDLIKNDPTISQQIENYIKKREILQEQQEDEKRAREQGLDHYEVTDEDLIAAREEEKAQQLKDKEFIEMLSEGEVNE